jgi:flagellar hook assembly protein FlgD
VPELIGAYIYADFGSGRIWSLRYDGVNPPDNIEIRDTNLNISSFGVDKNNELYLCAFDGKIYRFKSTTTSLKQGAIPTSNRLAQNYPNPFGNGAQALSSGNSSTTIRYTLSANTDVEMNIYNLQGQLVRHLLNKSQTSGEYTIAWDGRDDEGTILPSGTYFYRLKIDDALVTTRRLILLK